jgi:hypothetical protein
MTAIFENDGEFVRQGQLDKMRDGIVRDLEAGRILVPQTTLTPDNAFAGGANHFPNSDFNYSKAAAEVAGTLPGDAGDTNQEAWRLARQKRADNLVFDAAHALKAVGHSLYAANEGAKPEIPIWNRVNGWAELGGATGHDQYDIAVQLLGKIVAQSQKWYFNFRCVSLTDDLVPDHVQAYVGLWQKGATEGFASGDGFTITAQIHGKPGSVNGDYRILAKTDSGVTILSAVLNVPNIPDVLSADDYVTIFFESVSNGGFIEFQIFKKVGAVYTHLFDIRNSVDVQYHDQGAVGQPVDGWPVAPAPPLAYAETRNLVVGPFGQAWGFNRMSFLVPSTYDFSATNPTGQSLRFGLTNPTTVDRQIGIDYCFFSTSYSKWAPDVMAPFSPGVYPIPSISPTSAVQGTDGGLGDPPDTGSGGRGREILPGM